MKFDRRLTRAVLLMAGLIAAAVAFAALRKQGGASPQAWAAVAAALAVLAALVSAWTSQRLVELQEDALEPDLEPSIDARSRYQLVQFRLINRGHSSAYKIRVAWGEPPLGNVDGEIAKLGADGTLSALGPGETASVLLGAAHEFFARYENTTYSGVISFNNVAGAARSKQFVISGEHEREALMHDSEEPKTHFELQKVPGKLEAIALQIAELRKTLGNREP